MIILLLVPSEPTSADSPKKTEKHKSRSGNLGLLKRLAANYYHPKGPVGDFLDRGVIPKAREPIKVDGKLDEWRGAFITPVHIGHPDFANRGALFYFLWDIDSLYVGLKCLDRKPAHVAPDNQIYNGDAVEFYLDTRRGKQLGAKQWTPGTLHMFWTPFTKQKIQPRMQIRSLPVFRDFQLQGARVAAQKTAWGYTAEFHLPWKNFPNFTPKLYETIGIDCELCSSDGGLRVDRTFVYSSPKSVASPSAFGRVKLIEKFDATMAYAYWRALMPMSVCQSANYSWMYATVCISPTISDKVAKISSQIMDENGKVRIKSTKGEFKNVHGFPMWNGKWELFNLPPGGYTLIVTGLDAKDASVVQRAVHFWKK